MIAVAFKNNTDNNRRSPYRKPSQSLTDASVLITLILFWSMIELVLALLALCFPIIHSLFHRISLEFIIDSVRSLTSLASDTWRSPGSRSPITNIRNGNDSTASHARIVPIHGDLPTSVESIAMRDCSIKPHDWTVPQGEIGVNVMLTQSDDMV